MKRAPTPAFVLVRVLRLMALGLLRLSAREHACGGTRVAAFRELHKRATCAGGGGAIPRDKHSAGGAGTVSAYSCAPQDLETSMQFVAVWVRPLLGRRDECFVGEWSRKLERCAVPSAP
jgi:hypothetical protein